MDEVPSVPMCPPVWLSVVGHLLPPTSMDPQPGEAWTSSRFQCSVLVGLFKATVSLSCKPGRLGTSQVYPPAWRVGSAVSSQSGDEGWGPKFSPPGAPLTSQEKELCPCCSFLWGCLSYFFIPPCWSVDQASLCLLRMYKSNFSNTLKM